MAVILTPIGSPGGVPGGLTQTLSIRNASTSAVIPGATVRYAQGDSTRDTATSSSAGVALIGVVPGTYQRTVVAQGFDAVADTVNVTAAASQTISMQPLAQTGNPVHVAPGLAN